MANLDLNVQLKAFDSVSKKFQAINKAGKKLAEGFDKNVKALAKLDNQMKMIRSHEKLKKAMDDNGRAMVAAREKARALQQQLQNSGADKTAAQMRALRAQYQRANSEVGRLEGRQNRYRQSLGQTRSALRDAGINTRNLSSEQARLRQQAENLNRTLTEQSQRLQRLGEAQQRRQQAGAQYQQTMGMRNQAVGLATAGAAATYAGARFLKPGLELEVNLSEVQALTRLDKNSPQFKALAEQARHLGATTAYTSADAAAGQSFLAMAGFTPESIRAAMPSMLDLATAGKIDLPATADIASNILSGMSMDPTKDMGKIGDVLSAAFTRANLNISMLGETMKYAAPGASALGVSLEELAGMSGKLGDAGMQGSEGGTALRAIMQRLAGQPKDVADAMKELGVQATDAYGNLRPMPDILKDIHEVTQGMGNAEMMAYLSDISGLNASGAMVKLVEYAGNGELQTLIADIQGSQGELAKLSKTMGDNTMGDWKAMTSGIDGFRTAIFDANSGAIRDFLQNMTALTSKMTAWAQAHPELVAVMGKVFGILAIGAVVLGSIGAIMLTILGPMALLKVSISTLGLSGMLSPLAAISGAFAKIKTIIMGLRFAMIFNPIGLAIAAIAAGALLIYTYWEPIKAFFTGLWTGIKDGLAPLGGLISDLMQPISSALAPLQPAIDAIIGTLSMMGTQIDFSSDTLIKFQAVGAALGYAIGTVLQYLIASVVGFVSAIVIGFQTVGTAIGTTIGWIVVKGGELAAWFSALPERILSTLASLPSSMMTMGGQIMDGLKNGILGKAEAVIGAIMNVASRVKSAFTGTGGIDSHSPSRIFTKYGSYIPDGISAGIMGNDSPIKAILKTSKNLRGAMSSDGLDFGSTNTDVSARIRDREPMQFGNRAPLVATGMGNAQMSAAPSAITININGAADPHAIANEVRRALDTHQRNEQSRRRRRLTD